MEERKKSIKGTNRVKSAKDYIARKKYKSASQTHKGVKKERCHDFLPGKRGYCK